MGLLHDLKRIVIGETQRPQFRLDIPPGGREAAAFQKILEVFPGRVLHHPERPVEEVVGAVVHIDLFAEEVHIDEGAGAMSAHIGHPHGAAFWEFGVQVLGHDLPGSAKLLGHLLDRATLGQQPLHSAHIGSGELLFSPGVSGVFGFQFGGDLLQLCHIVGSKQIHAQLPVIRRHWLAPFYNGIYLI